MYKRHNECVAPDNNPNGCIKSVKKRLILTYIFYGFHIPGEVHLKNLNNSCLFTLTYDTKYSHFSTLFNVAKK